MRCQRVWRLSHTFYVLSDGFIVLRDLCEVIYGRVNSNDDVRWYEYIYTFLAESCT